MFPLRYNFSFRFLMWKSKGGNPKGLAAPLVFPLLQSPFLNPAPPAALAQKRRARLPSSVSLRWRKRRARATLYADFNA